MQTPHHTDTLPAETLTPHVGEQQEASATVVTDLQHGLNIFSASRCGSYHERNEDRIYFNKETGFYGLADGVGGGQFGDLAAETLLHYLSEHTTIDSSNHEIVTQLHQADKQVRATLQAKQDSARGAATLVAAWLDNDAMGRYTHVGDARIYLLSTRQETVTLTQLTQDQTYANLGKTAPEGGADDDPARMIGVGGVGSPQVQPIHLASGQGLLFCSDGVHKFLASDTMEEICAAYLLPGGSFYDQPHAVCHALVNAAIASQSHDDCSALLLYRHGTDTAPANPASDTETTWFRPSLSMIILTTILSVLLAGYALFLLWPMVCAVPNTPNKPPIRVITASEPQQAAANQPQPHAQPAATSADTHYTASPPVGEAPNIASSTQVATPVQNNTTLMLQRQQDSTPPHRRNHSEQ